MFENIDSQLNIFKLSHFLSVATTQIRIFSYRSWLFRILKLDLLLFSLLVYRLVFFLQFAFSILLPKWLYLKFWYCFFDSLLKNLLGLLNLVVVSWVIQTILLRPIWKAGPSKINFIEGIRKQTDMTKLGSKWGQRPRRSSSHLGLLFPWVMCWFQK